MKQLLTSIGINLPGHYEGDDYVVDIDNSDMFYRVFSKLDNTDLLDEEIESSQVGLDATNVIYSSDDYVVNLIANFEDNTYSLICKEIKDEEK